MAGPARRAESVPARADASGWLGLLLLCGIGVLSALIEVLLIPLRAGATFVPVTIVFAAVGAHVLPRAARSFVERTSAMVLAVASWLVPALMLSVMPRPEGDVLVPGGGGEQWVFYGMLLGGAVVGTATIVLSGSRRR